MASGTTGSVSPVRLVDSFRVLHPDVENVGTFNRFRGDRAGEKIDYVLVEPTTTVLRAQILHDNSSGRYPSDHFPVTARLRCPPPARARR